MSLRDGDPLACPCGATLVVIWQDRVTMGPPGQRIETGRRFIYGCNACGRRVRLELFERNLRRAPRTEGQGPGPA